MNYILYTDNTFMHFFQNYSLGLCKKVKKDGHWSDTVSLYSKAEEGFFVYPNSDGIIHILCTNENNDIVYINNKGKKWNTHILSHGNSEISPIEFKIAKAGNILNFFYSAHYKGSVILVHCVLGANARPETIDTLLPDYPHFSVNSGKIYYTNKNGILGYRNFSDSKPDSFFEITPNAVYPYAVTINGDEYLLYKKNGFIFLNGNEIFADPSAASPIICAKDNRLTVQWKSGHFVRYLTSFNNGTTWSAPMRFIGSGEKICKFCIFTNSEPHICYGQDILPEPIIYGKTNLFFTEAPKSTSTEDFVPTEYKKLRILIDMQNKEIKALKSRIKKLENSD